MQSGIIWLANDSPVHHSIQTMYVCLSCVPMHKSSHKTLHEEIIMYISNSLSSVVCDQGS